MCLPMLTNSVKLRKVTVITPSKFMIKVINFLPIESRMNLVNNTNLHFISHRFLVIADYWSNFRFRQGAPLFNALVRDDRKLASEKTRKWKHHSIVCISTSLTV